MISHSDSGEQPTSLNEALGIASRLSDRDKLRLIARLSAQLEQEPVPQMKRSLLGALAHLGPAPSSEDIDEARHQMLENFPREAPIRDGFSHLN